MKPAPFTYHDPASLEEALRLLEELGPAAKVIAGGQSLVPLLNFRLARPEALIDLGRVPGLTGIQLDGDTIRIGAMTTHREVAASPVLREHCPLLPAAAELVGHAAIRSRGTIGGSIAHADPAAELPLALCALGGRVRLRSLRGERVLPASDFFLTIFTTAMAEGELLVAVEVPVAEAGAGWSLQEVSRRHGDFALVAVAVCVRLAERNTVRSLRVVFAGVGDRPVDVSDQVQHLAQQPLTVAWLESLAAAATAGLEPGDDLHASADARRRIARALAVRAVQEAAVRAGLTIGGDGT